MKALALINLIGEGGSASSSIVTALQTAFSSIASDVTSVLTTILPIALGVVGAGVVIIFGVKWFKRLTNKA